MAVRVYASGQRIVNLTDAYGWQVEDHYLRIELKSGDLLAEFAPGNWDYVVDLDPVLEEAE